MSNTISQTGSSAGSAGKHTPTPWYYNGDTADVYSERDQKMVARCSCGDDWMRNAAFIVKAVNAHDDLVRALSDLCEWANAQAGNKMPAPLGRAMAALAKASS